VFVLERVSIGNEMMVRQRQVTYQVDRHETRASSFDRSMLDTLETVTCLQRTVRQCTTLDHTLLT